MDEEAYKTLENQLEDAKKCVTQAASRRYARGTDVVACISQAIAAGALKKTKKAPETCVTVSVAQCKANVSGAWKNDAVYSAIEQDDEVYQFYDRHKQEEKN